MNDYHPEAKEKTIYLLLGLLLGFFGLPGVHNLYAGHTNRGLIQLLGTILSCGVLWLPMYIWVIVEACTEKYDGNGIPFK